MVVSMATVEASLAAVLAQIKAHDEDHAFRYQLVLNALLLARTAGLECGFGIHRDSDGRMDGFRVVVYIMLPTGLTSWHMPEWGGVHDGHTTRQKYARIDAFIRMVELNEEWTRSNGQ